MAGQTLKSGTIIGDKYRLDRPIGRGGFGTVYQAVHTAIERTVAIKIFDPADPAHVDPTKAKERADRFVKEARLVSQLEHPNTVTIHDFGLEDDGKAYLVMEFIEGLTLGELLNEEAPLDRQRTITIFLQILGSLEEAHHRSILHRDLKPSNIMLTENFKGEEIVKVLDFGIARMLQQKPADTDESDDQETSFCGTPRYCAPEQLLEGELSLSTDVYGVGSLMWACLVGRPMMPSGEFFDFLRHATHPRPWTIPDEADVDADLSAIIEKAVRKSPPDRYDDASTMLAALRQYSTVTEGDLPEIRHTPFDNQQRIVDPNIVDPDEAENYFLNPDNADDGSPENSRRPAPKKVADRSKKEPAPLELDTDAVPEVNREGRRKPQPSRRDHSRSHVNSRSNGGDPSTIVELLRRPQTIIGAVAFVAAAVIAIFLLANSEIDITPEAERQAALSDDSSAPVDEEILAQLADESIYSVDGILLSLRTQGWRVDDSRDTIAMSRYRYRPATVYRDELQIDIAIYETHDSQTRLEVENQVAYPDESITFDHIVVRVSPRNAEAEVAARQLTAFLANYRDLVAREAAE